MPTAETACQQAAFHLLPASEIKAIKVNCLVTGRGEVVNELLLSAPPRPSPVRQVPALRHAMRLNKG
jgi:hypothetical protein